MTAKRWNAWTPADDALLREHWHNGEPTKRLATRFPGRTPGAVLAHGYVMGLGRRDCQRESFSPVWEGVKQLLARGKMMTARELAKALKVTPHAVQQCTRDRHGTEVHIGGYAYASEKSPRVRRWKLGPGPDAPLPPHKTRKEINRDYSRRMWKDPEFAARQNQRARLRYAEKTGKLIRPDAAFRWMQVAPQHDTQLLDPMEHRSAGGEPRAATLFPQGGAGLLGRSTPNHTTP